MSVVDTLQPVGRNIVRICACGRRSAGGLAIASGCGRLAIAGGGAGCGIGFAFEQAVAAQKIADEHGARRSCDEAACTARRRKRQSWRGVAWRRGPARWSAPCSPARPRRRSGSPGTRRPASPIPPPRWTNGAARTSARWPGARRAASAWISSTRNTAPRPRCRPWPRRWPRNWRGMPAPRRCCRSACAIPIIGASRRPGSRCCARDGSAPAWSTRRRSIAPHPTKRGGAWPNWSAPAWRSRRSASIGAPIARRGARGIKRRAVAAYAS